MSHYYYVLQEPRHYLHGDIAGGRMSLAEYVASGITTEVDNGQTRLLAGEELSQQPHGESATPFGRCDRGMLDLAKARLAHNFAVVGVSERFDEAVVLMQRALGWRAPFYLPLNITHQRPTIDDIPTASVEAIRSRNTLDTELYDEALRRFNALVDGDGSVMEEAARLRRRRRIVRLLPQFERVDSLLQRIGLLAGRRRRILWNLRHRLH